ncbi:hypothetical protein B0A69_09685 [Chryseobacterium shigense]|uniref:TIGR04255 family protein n=1 Tax=Chryseobacterium shigense TaxID=297244 RepID=A0A1N7IGY5_9FLAO|nr:TIGR04255 family protein [Chryseobacterium shigense]PQA94711.1 hypothetical protein B0A69_09685 [Chryseobacterium shigense]SIS36211.1 TIGR04255 family protein [Chryseobacterium shigense]
MQIPERIDDRIQDAHVVIKLSYEMPFQILFGNFYDNVIKSGSYDSIATPDENNNTSATGNRIMFYDDEIKFILTDEILFINIRDNYIGWNIYLVKILEVISFISSNKSILISRIGLRYINVYEHYNLKDITKFSFSFAQPDIKSKRFNFSTEFEYENTNVILNLVNDYKNEDSNFLSLMDIDCYANKNDFFISNNDLVKQELSNIHKIQESIFFSLLKEEFLETLNPIY